MPKRSRQQSTDEVDEDEEDYEVEEQPAKRASNGKGKGKARAVDVDEDEADEEEEGFVGENDNAVKVLGHKTMEERRALRAQLRALDEEARDMNDHAETTKPEDLVKNLRKGNSIFKHVDDNGDAAIDSRTIRLNADTASKLGKGMRALSNAFDMAQFMTPLRILLGQNLLADDEAEEDEDGNAPEMRKNGTLGDWEKVGWLAVKRSRRVLGGEFMNGMMAIEHKKRVVNRKARQVAVAGPEVKPIEVRQEDMAKAENETVQMVKNIDELLEEVTSERGDKNLEPLNLFEWFINPHSFGQSVENLFYTSFLVNQSKASIEVDENGKPTIMASQPANNEDLAEGVKKRQVVMELTMDIWKDAIETFNIREPVIPHRTYERAGLKTSTAWY